MLQETLLRLNKLENITNPIVICNEDHRFLVAEQCKQINIKNPTILLEPVGRGTAPAIAAAAFQSIKDYDNSILLVLSADHVIQNIDAFHKAVKVANREAESGKIAIFGVEPTHANTGYGYIKSSKDHKNGVCKVLEFFEKPDQKTAELYLKKGGYLWNSGMFMFQSRGFIDELTRHAPDIVTSVNHAFTKAEKDLDFIRLEKEAFEASPVISIDYALLEKSNNVFVVPLDANWSDIGSWSTLYDINDKDSSGNILKGDVIAEETTNTYIYASRHLITTFGVDNLVVIDTPDTTLIASRDKVHQVNTIVQSLQKKGRNEAVGNRKVYRPWGWYDSIERGKNFQVKRLHIKPGAKLSLQMHYKRAEHWVVVIGTALVTNGEETLVLNQGESTYIPLGVTHAIENQTNELLEIIEVQSGVYLGEDDIVRFDDIYGRI